MEDEKKFTLEEVKVFIKAFHLDSNEGQYSNELRVWSDNWIKKNIVDEYFASSFNGYCSKEKTGVERCKVICDKPECGW